MTAELTKLPQRGDRFEAYGLGYRAVAGDGTIRITVRRLRRDHGALRGYVDVEFKAKGSPKGTLPSRLAGEQLNLSSGRDRTTFVNRLGKRKAGIEWENIIDVFCVEVENREDDQTPPIQIGRLPAPINGGWLLEGLLERCQVSSVHGDGSVGKSWIALAAAFSIVTGLEIIPGFRPMLRGNVLILDWETDQDTPNTRIQQIARGAGVDPPDGIWYLRMDAPFSDHVERLMAYIQEHDIVLVIIDSVEAAMSGSVSAGAPPNEGPAKINRGLRRLGVTALLIDHISSEQAASDKVADRAYGNRFKRNWVRISYHLKQTRDAAADGYRHLGFFHAKRNNGKDFDPVGLRWEINDEVCRWTREDIDEPELEVSLPNADRIAAYLRREGPCQQTAIVDAMNGIPRTTVISTLTRRHDLFFKNRHGLWDAKPKAADPMPPDDDIDGPDPLPWPERADAGDAGA